MLLSSSFNKVFDLEEKVYYVQFESQKLDGGPHLLDKLIAFERETRRMFRTVLKTAFEGHGEDDEACIVVGHPDLEEDITVTLREISTISEDTILSHIDEEKPNAEKPFKLKFTILHM